MLNRKKRMKGPKEDNLLAYVFLGPYLILFVIFILLPVLMAAALAFTDFNSIERPRFIGFDNFIQMFSGDMVLVRHVIPNTLRFAIIVGPVGYALQFLMAWLVLKLPRVLRRGYTMAIYSSSLVGGVMMSVVWVVAFSGDRYGYLNNFLIWLGAITGPLDWTQRETSLMVIMIFVTLWSSMGVGFLSLQAGMFSVDPQLYEAGVIDGVQNGIQEIWYITIPAMKPQMLFAAVMAMVGTLRAGGIGVTLSGMNPTPRYAGQLLQNHIDDFGFIRMELGYATSLTFAMLAAMLVINRVVFKLLGKKEDE
ncbi:MAG: sugar ABC transporter permease [Defluviitaleaceae bacterium]|nr:sugar ABC transporter permease [Defluviitaleaceae bacterium]